ncbi:MAG TPA: hypothetical protein VKB59_19530 [Micromonosporaceae bacterium]|nr:hypothetical protein [Micromonosporaceae bacterium]
MTWVWASVAMFALATLTAVPLIVLAIIYADTMLETLARRRRRARKTRELVLPVPVGPPLEKIATDLRRIGAARRKAMLGSLGYTILTTQFDKQLANGCRALGIEHRLDELTGFDLDVERERVASALSSSGLLMSDADIEQDVDG